MTTLASVRQLLFNTGVSPADTHARGGVGVGGA